MNIYDDRSEPKQGRKEDMCARGRNSWYSQSLDVRKIKQFIFLTINPFRASAMFYSTWLPHCYHL